MKELINGDKDAQSSETEEVNAAQISTCKNKLLTCECGFPGGYLQLHKWGSAPVESSVWNLELSEICPQTLM